MSCCSVGHFFSFWPALLFFAFAYPQFLSDEKLVFSLDVHLRRLITLSEQLTELLSRSSKTSGAGEGKTVVHTFSQPKLPPQIKNKLRPKGKTSLGRVARERSHTCKRSKMRRKITTTDTELRCSAKINLWNQPCKPSWFHQSVTQWCLRTEGHRPPPQLFRCSGKLLLQPKPGIQVSA